MPVICWGPLAKSAQDSTTIASYIAGKILEHNVNPSAHGLDGYAVYNHRLATLIDHLDGSVSLQKMVRDYYVAMIAFESLDGWSVSAGVTNEILNLLIQTGTVINTTRYVFTVPDFVAINWDKDMFFQASIKVVYNTDQIVYWVAGSSQVVGVLSNFGFKVVDGTLYALHTVTDGGEVEYTTEITGITITDWNIYRAEYDQDAGEIRFYVNGVLKVTHDSNIPTSADNDDTMMSFEIKNTAGANKVLRVADLLWSRKR